MRKRANNFAPACEPSLTKATSSWAFFTTAFIAVGGLTGPVFAADPAVNTLGNQVAQAAPLSLTASSSVQGELQQAITQPASGEVENTSDAHDPDVQLAQAAIGAIAGGHGAISPSTGPQQATAPIPGAGGVAITGPLPQSPYKNPYALADSLKYKGFIVPLPGAADTVDQGLGGVRTSLAEDGISWFGFSTTTWQDNVIRHGLPPGNQFGPHSRDLQQYAGQLPTYTTANTLFLMYDLSRYGIPDGQITLAGSLLETNWQPGDPNGIGIGQLSYYQTLFNKLIEFKVGYLTNNLEYLGVQVGGNIASGLFGVSAAIPFETGQNLGSFATPAVNIKVNLPDHVYTKFGVQRSTSPDGLQIERLENATNVRFTVPNAGVYVIDETGYRVSAAPGQMSTWIRGAASYSSSRYVNFNTGGRQPTNYSFFFLADRQILKTAPHGGIRTAYQGLYVGVSAMNAPNYLNAFSEYYEARVYGFGLIPGRPFDLLSLVANRNVFSADLVHLEREGGLLAHSYANTYTAAYDVHVVHGVNLDFGVSYTDHPSPIVYNRSTGSSLSILTNLFIWL